ncbi:MAG: GNAT family N-acetyltransferase [Pararhodobacter sp.]
MTSADRLFAALDATWPAASEHVSGPFVLRDGAGGGKRVSATILTGDYSDAALDAAEAAMGDPRLFQVRSGQHAFDDALAARGYAVVDPTILYEAPIAIVAEAARPVTLLGTWPPLAIQRQIWTDGGIGPERIAVMHRVLGSRNAFIARFRNRAAGVGFVAIHDGIAMLHALHVEPDFRRQGVARYMVRGMAHWAQGQGAETFALAVTERNLAARALYSALGMSESASYHYREKLP